MTCLWHCELLQESEILRLARGKERIDCVHGTSGAVDIFVYAIRTLVVGFSSGNFSAEVFVVCAFIIGGADLWPVSLDGQRSFVVPLSYLQAHNRFLRHRSVKRQLMPLRVPPKLF